MTLGDEKGKEFDKKGPADQCEDVTEGEREVNTWTEEMASQWMERKVSKVYEVRTADKRKEDNPEWMSSIPVKQAKRHKKFEVVKEGWDEGTLVVVDGVEPYLPLPQRVGGRLRGGRSSAPRTSRPPDKLNEKRVHPFFISVA